MVNKTAQHNKDFFYTYEMFSKSVIKLANILRTNTIKYRNIYAIPRGGLILGVALSHELKIPLTNDKLKPDTLVVDDICDTGKTLKGFEHLTRVVLVTKPKGLNINKDLIYDMIVEDDTWVHFPWEKQNKERQVKLNDYI